MVLRSATCLAVLMTALVFATGAAAYPRDDAAVVEVDVYSRADIHRLNELGMDIMNVRDGVAEIAAVPGEIEALWANGFRPRVVVENMRDAFLAQSAPYRGVYHNYSAITADLAAWHAAYPSITELISIGRSVQGRELWALKITDNPGIEEAEPEIVWVGAHHGDETISVETCYYAAKYLLENHGTNPQVTWLVNNREFWVIPMINPDGHTNGSRYNAQGTDLNRNYLCPDGSNAGSAFSAPETQALRDFCVGMNPVTSLQFHSGAVYVNYLWDYSYDPTPDEPMIITLSNGYGSRSGLPVTNGADWYVAKGTCQDWCYDQRGEIATTIEVSTSKNPPASNIDGIVNANIPAMLYQARKSGKGIRGIVTDAGTGEPLYATISIPQIGKDVYTDPAVGDYHRMVQQGTYTVTASAPEYQSQTVYNVVANLDTFVVVNFALEPPPRGTIAGYVFDQTMNPLSASVTVTDIGGYSAVSDPVTGYYEINHVPVGAHDMRVTKAGYSTVTRAGVQVVYGTTVTESFLLPSPVFYDDLESGLSRWTGAWGLTTGQFHSPSSSMTDSPSGNYGNNANIVMTLGSPVDLGGASSATLSFWHRYDTESGYDLCRVSVSANNGSSWTQVASYSGTQSAWTEVSFDVTAYATSQFKVRFALTSDSWITRDGWYVDDVQISRDAPSAGVPGEGTERSRIALSGHPNPFSAGTGVRYVLPMETQVRLAVYDVSGRLVRTLLDGEIRPAGAHESVWDGRDERGLEVATGVYFARVACADGESTAKLVLIR
ncbi:MAG: carboxypeptidase regulatory-like domain-containing protein [Candidatus Eisenbacteria bacterium]|nr:carboxypeptidase regulatory-like domain-containing protein [Candidatus Eisenbacteria bacterium]